MKTIPEMSLFYREKGYLLLENFFDSTRIEAAKQAIDDILNRDDPNSIAEMEPADKGLPRRIWGATFKHQFFDAMSQDPMLLDVLSLLIGNDIIFHYSRINMKAPKIGSPVEWHQDFAYNPHTNTDLVTCLIFLDDADKTNGCLQVVPGSHHDGMCDHYIDNYFRGKVSLENMPHAGKTHHLPVKAGSVIFLHCLTLHKSDPNLSPKARRVFLPSYRAADSFPIYFGQYTSEPKTKLIRGQLSHYARVEEGKWLMPFAENVFSSLYEIQEGSHLNKENPSTTGYYGKSISGAWD